MSRSVSSSRPPAVILGLNPNGLGIVKSLRKAGIEAVGVDRAPADWTNTHTWMSSKTRLCRSKLLLPPACTRDDMLHALLGLGHRLGGRPPLMPSGDSELMLISENREELSEYYRFHVPEHDVLELLLEKGRFYEACERWAVPIPRTLVHPTMSEIAHGSDTLRYPVLVKPDLRDAKWQARYGHAKAVECADPDELAGHVRTAIGDGMQVLVQEVVPGGDDSLYFSHGYIGSDGRLLGLWTGRKIRQHPLHFGTSTLVESLWTAEVAEYSLRIVRELGLEGYFSVEFKKDELDGSFKAMEVTPSRTWYPHLLGVSVGVNIPAIWYEDLVGGVPPDAPTSDTPDGIRWVDEYRDVIAAVESIHQGNLTVLGWMGSYRRTRSFALASLRDPIPLAAALLRMSRSFVRQFVLRTGDEPS